MGNLYPEWCNTILLITATVHKSSISTWDDINIGPTSATPNEINDSNQCRYIACAKERSERGHEVYMIKKKQTQKMKKKRLCKCTVSCKCKIRKEEWRIFNLIGLYYCCRNGFFVKTYSQSNRCCKLMVNFVHMFIQKLGMKKPVIVIEYTFWDQQKGYDFKNKVAYSCWERCRI